jgi:hypothetical protein
MFNFELGRWPFHIAHLNRMALEQASIEHELRDDRTAIIGAAPMEATWLSIWIDSEDEARAREAIASVEPSSTEQPAVSVRPKAPPERWLAALLALAVVGFGWALYVEKKVPKYYPSAHTTFEWLGACLSESLDAKLVRRMCDKNFDGTFESIEAFDANGHLTSKYFDVDNDGQFERSESFDTKGILTGQYFDSNQNGLTERAVGFLNGKVASRSFDANEDGVTEEETTYVDDHIKWISYPLDPKRIDVFRDDVKTVSVDLTQVH